MTTKTKLILSGQDKTKAAFDSVNRRLGGMEASAAKAQRAFGLLIGAGAIGGLVKGVVDASLAMDRFQRAFKVATGSAEGAAREMAFVIRTSQELGTSIEESAGAFAKLSAAARGTELQGAETRKIFTAISQASVVLGLTAEQTGGALTAIEQIISKGKVSAEELRGQLGERLPGAFQIAARAIGVTTSELDDMLRKGEVLAEDLLPALATELSNVFAPGVEEAADSAQAAFTRFSNSVFLVKDSIARTGLIDVLADVAAGFALIISPSDEQRIVLIRGRLKELNESLKDFDSAPVRSSIRALREELLELLKAQSLLQNAPARRNEVGAIKAGALVSKASAELDEFFGKQDKALEKLRQRFVGTFETAEQEVTRLLGEFDLVAATFPPEDQERIRTAIRETLNEGLEEVVVRTKRRFTKPMNKEMDAIVAASEQAARNIQDAFADFLFDPFEDGVKGMLKSFLDAIRQMLANQAATQLFGFLKDLIPIPGASGKIPGKALGGPVSAGSLSVVGEKGPELFIPGSSGTIIPNNKIGGNSVTIIQNNDFTNADSSLLRALPALLEQTKEATKAEILLLQREGRFA